MPNNAFRPRQRRDRDDHHSEGRGQPDQGPGPLEVVEGVAGGTALVHLIAGGAREKSAAGRGRRLQRVQVGSGPG